MLSHWTKGAESLSSELFVEGEEKAFSPISLELSNDFLDAMRQIPKTVEEKLEKNRVSRKYIGSVQNWQYKPDPLTNNHIIKKICSIMNVMHDKVID